jgi:adenosylcobinamide amidohydrolase
LSVVPELIAPAGVHARLAWRLGPGYGALSSAAVGGGFTSPDWIVNIGVASDYGRVDLDAHAAEVAAAHELHGIGIALFTAALVERWTTASDDEVRVDATVGVSHPTWAAAPADAPLARWTPGTINLVVQVPVALTPAAAVNAVITATEAKSQALWEVGAPGTGTASDAIAIVWPDHGRPEAFAGPRSEIGAALARAAHAAVRAGLESAG